MTKTISLRNFDFISLTDKGLEREKNEDYLAYFDTFNGHVFVVCDGMGGHQAGEIASKTATEAIGIFFNTDYYKNPFEAIENAIVHANKKVFAYAQQNPDLYGMGTTIVLALIRDNLVYYGHTGDSRLYTFSQNSLTQLTRDHSYVNQLVDKNIITEKEAKNHPRSNEITRALGLTENIEPDVTSSAFLPAENDMLLLCSDGLNNMVQDKCIKKILSSDIIIEQKASELINKAIANGGIDNISVQIVRFHNIDRNYKPEAISNWTKKEGVKFFLNKKMYFIGLLLAFFVAYFVFFNEKNDNKQAIEHDLIISKGHNTTKDGLLMIYPYKIKANDKLELIAENFNLNVDDLKLLNPNIDELIEGMHLKIPIQDTYIIQGDDEIQLISSRYNIDPVDIMRINDFCEIKLTVGRELVIPLAPKKP